MQENQFENDKEELMNNKPNKKKSPVFSVFVLIFVFILVSSILLTYALTSSYYEKKLVGAKNSKIASGSDSFSSLESFFSSHEYYDIDTEKMTEIAMKAYVAASNDPYAVFYTPEEYSEYMNSSNGNKQGIGIYYTQTTEPAGIQIDRINKNSPAETAGLQIGDIITGVYDTSNQLVTYEQAGLSNMVNLVSGQIGDIRKLQIYRGGSYLEIECTLATFENTTVDYKISSTDSTVGIVYIFGFDKLTPKQFNEAMQSLIGEGITKFVFDIRDNGGGDLNSILAVLSTFLDEGQKILSVTNKQGATTIYRAQERTYKDSSYVHCTITKDDIGKYKGYSYAVLVNNKTASAAELFTINFKDYNLGKIVGTTTYGKGVLQSIYRFGEGGIRLTTNAYNPPVSENYDGKGITPDYVVELTPAAQNTPKLIRIESQDSQLQKAITTLE